MCRLTFRNLGELLPDLCHSIFLGSLLGRSSAKSGGGRAPCVLLPCLMLSLFVFHDQPPRKLFIEFFLRLHNVSLLYEDKSWDLPKPFPAAQQALRSCTLDRSYPVTRPQHDPGFHVPIPALIGFRRRQRGS